MSAAPDTRKPCRVQLRRAKGFRLPPGTIRVDRATRWGNPFTHIWKPSGHRSSRRVLGDLQAVKMHISFDVEMFRLMLVNDGRWTVPARPCFACTPTTVEDVRRELAGKDLACWCPADLPCHADVLLEIANGWPCPPRIERTKPSPAMEAGIAAMKALHHKPVKKP